MEEGSSTMVKGLTNRMKSRWCLRDSGLALTVPHMMVANYPENSQKNVDVSIFPIPDFAKEPFHLHLLPLHFDHPGVLEHPPRRCSSGWLFLKAKSDQ